MKTQTLKIQGQETNMRVGYLTKENLDCCHYIKWKKSWKWKKNTVYTDIFGWQVTVPSTGRVVADVGTYLIINTYPNEANQTQRPSNLK